MEKNDLFDLDFSMVTDSTAVNTEELRDKILDSLTEVLSSCFTSNEKRRIIKVGNRLNFACPYCGDSLQNARKKRGNLYMGNLFYRCYNTGCEHASLPFVRFVEDFKLKDNFTANELLYMRSRKTDVDFGNYNPKQFAGAVSKLDEYSINREYLMSLLGIKEVFNTRNGMEYLRKRKQDQMNMNLFGFDDHRDDLYFFNLNGKGDRVISTQIRHLRAGKNDRRFTTHNYSKLITDFVKIEDPDPDVMIMMDRYGLIYNILRVKMTQTLDILEGPMDCNHITNSVATMSASTKVYFSHGRYLYDNTTIDNAGRYASIDMLNKGYKVFGWKKFLDDYSKFSHCKDVNDIVRLDDKFPFNEIKNDYYISDKLDLIYL